MKYLDKQPDISVCRRCEKPLRLLMMNVSDFKCFIPELVSHSAAERAARENHWNEWKDAADWKKPHKRITEWELFTTAESSSEVSRISFKDAYPFLFVQIMYIHSGKWLWYDVLLCVCSVLQVISLQNQIWDLEQEKSRRGETGLQPDRTILGKLLPIQLKYLDILWYIIQEVQFEARLCSFWDKKWHSLPSQIKSWIHKWSASLI